MKIFRSGAAGLILLFLFLTPGKPGLMAADRNNIISEPLEAWLAFPAHAACAGTGISAPAQVSATALSDTEIAISWINTSSNVDTFVIERRKANETGWSNITAQAIPAGTTSFIDSGLSPATTYIYRLFCIATDGTVSPYSNEAAADTKLSALNPPPLASLTTMLFHIGSFDYTVNGQVYTMEAPPTELQGRTLLPIRYVVEPLGGTVAWLPESMQVSIFLNGKYIDLWLNQPNAKVNGAYVPVDAGNPLVVPTVVPPGRTMVPLRFVAENLGGIVAWNGAAQEITITFGQP